METTLNTPGRAPAAVDRALVRQTLIENPEWVREDAELLSVLAQPASNSNIVDLGAVIRDKLLRQVRDLKARHAELARHAQANLAVLARAQAFVISLMDCSDLDELDYKLAWEAPASLGVDAVRLYLEGQTPMVVAESILPCSTGLVDELLGDENDFTGLCPQRTGRLLYGEVMGSHALCRISIDDQVGMLALASHDESCFHSGQSTEMLNFVTRAIERRLERWMIPG